MSNIKKEQVTYFIADLHLAENRPDITACFLSFLKDEAIKAEKLYILGDLFEVWFGDDYDTKLNRDVANTLKSLSESGTEVLYIHGNRDFVLGKQYANMSGMTLLPEKHVINLYDEKVLIMHGDTLCTMDIDYQKFRKKSRSWWWLGFMTNLPFFIRKKVAENYRKKSNRINR